MMHLSWLLFLFGLSTSGGPGLVEGAGLKLWRFHGVSNGACPISADQRNQRLRALSFCRGKAHGQRSKEHLTAD